jgi:prepilin signal peptidase PulO-like enzyme (type II secretory pathway)
VSIAVATAILSFHAASQSSFGVLGRTPEDAGWSYTVALFINFSVTAIALAASIWTAKQPSLSRMMKTISAASSGTWLGFYYGGILSGGKNPEPAIGGAIVGALLMAVNSFYFRNKLVKLAIAIMGIVAAYGLAFLCSAATFAFFSTNNFWWGGCWGILGAIAIGLTIFFIDLLMLEIMRYRW